MKLIQKQICKHKTIYSKACIWLSVFKYKGYWSNIAHYLSDIQWYSMQHYVIMFISDLRQAGGFSLGTAISSINKNDRHDITEILLKGSLNTIPPSPFNGDEDI
jgi:hypothetical protein